MDLEGHRAARRRLAWAHAHQAVALAKLLERDPDAIVGTDGMLPCIWAWNAFSKADDEYREAKGKEEE